VLRTLAEKNGRVRCAHALNPRLVCRLYPMVCVQRGKAALPPNGPTEDVDSL